MKNPNTDRALCVPSEKGKENICNAFKRKNQRGGGHRLHLVVAVGDPDSGFVSHLSAAGLHVTTTWLTRRFIVHL
jgi:hypothetical protein